MPKTTPSTAASGTAAPGAATAAEQLRSAVKTVDGKDFSGQSLAGKPAVLWFWAPAGLVAALNPCGFAMLPAYLTLVVVGNDGGTRSRTALVGRALAATAAMALGFLGVFGVFGFVVAPLAASVQQYLPAITVVIGAGLIGLGIWMLTRRELTVLLPS